MGIILAKFPKELQGALNYKIEREHAPNSFGSLPQGGYCERKTPKS